MIVRQQFRRLAATVSILALLVWALAGVATMPVFGHGPQCHGQMAGIHSPAPMMLAACCPRHASSTLGCPAHARLTVVAVYRPDCCAVSNRPSQPVAFVVTSRTGMQSGIQVPASPNLAPDLTHGTILARTVSAVHSIHIRQKG